MSRLLIILLNEINALFYIYLFKKIFIYINYQQEINKKIIIKQRKTLIYYYYV